MAGKGGRGVRARQCERIVRVGKESGDEGEGERPLESLSSAATAVMKKKRILAFGGVTSWSSKAPKAFIRPEI